jgi:hypothetical protein
MLGYRVSHPIAPDSGIPLFCVGLTRLIPRTSSSSITIRESSGIQELREISQMGSAVGPMSSSGTNERTGDALLREKRFVKGGIFHRTSDFLI